MFKGIAKNSLKKMRINSEERVTFYRWDWPSAKSLRLHLVKHCEKIEMVES